MKQSYHEKIPRGHASRVMQSGRRKLLKAELHFTSAEIKTLPTLAGHEKLTVDELLTKEIEEITESEIRDYGILISQEAKDAIRAKWDGKLTKTQQQSNLTTYSATLALKPGRVDAIRHLALANDMTVEDFLSEQARVSIIGTIGCLLDEKVLSHDEGVEIYKIWGGDDPAYLE